MATTILSSRRLFGGLSGRRGAGPRASMRRTRRTSRPTVEGLEGRVVLSTVGLDPTYGFGGVALTNVPQNTSTATFYQSISAIAPQSGKTVEVGTLTVDTSTTTAERMVVSRLNADGSIDTTFGSGGSQVISIISGGVTYDVYADDVAVQSNGTIDVLGTANSTTPAATDFVVAQLTSNGVLDTTFGTGGFRLIDFSTMTGSLSAYSSASALSIDPSGKIVAVGSTSTPTGFNDFAIARLNTNGSLDTSFNTSGMQVVPFDLGGSSGISYDTAGAVVVQPDSKIVVAGMAQPLMSSTAGSQAAVARLNADGSLDTSFNGTGKLTYTYSLGGNSDDSANALALQGSQIVIAGTSSVNFPSGSNFNVQELTVTRLNANGSFDASFNGSGKFILAVSQAGIDFNTSASSIVVLPDGSLLAGGNAHEKNTFYSNYGGFLAKLTSGGTLDPTYDHGGVAILPTSINRSMVMQPDGKVLFATYDGVARVTAPPPAVMATKILTSGAGKKTKATALTLTFNTGLNETLSKNIKVYVIHNAKGKNNFKIKKNGITYEAATQTLTIRFANKTAIGKGFQVVLAPGAIIGADGQVLASNTIPVPATTM